MSSYELDFLPVGNGERSGDAITLRYGPAPLHPDTQTVIVIDAGYSETGEDVVAHLADYYDTDHVDLAISTHPDQDHINGLKTLLEHCVVDELWMHQPWLHNADLAAAKDSRFASRSGETAKGLQGAADLEALALGMGIPIIQPFAGHASNDGVIRVLGPTLDYYARLLPFDPPASAGASASLLSRAVMATATRIREALHMETLSTDGGVVSDRNNSSTVLLLSLYGRRLLLTGDAGVEALTPVADHLKMAGIAPGGLDVVQMPHHGSRRNVGSVLLDDLLGTYPAGTRGSAIASASAEAPKHPHPQATNAFLRRGYPVFTTEGKAVLSSQNSQRGWGPLTPLPFQTEFEDD